MAAQLSASQVSHWNDLLRNTGISTSRQLMHLHKIIFHLSNQTRFHADKLLRTEVLDSSLLHGWIDSLCIEKLEPKNDRKNTAPALIP